LHWVTFVSWAAQAAAGVLQLSLVQLQPLGSLLQLSWVASPEQVPGPEQLLGVQTQPSAGIAVQSAWLFCSAPPRQ